MKKLKKLEIKTQNSRYDVLHLLYSGFQATCNPHDDYVHITGYPVRHGDSLYFLWGENLQFTVRNSRWQFATIHNFMGFLHLGLKKGLI